MQPEVPSIEENEKMQEDFDGYREYRRRVDLNKLVTFQLSYDPIVMAIDDLYEKLFDNNARQKELSNENMELRELVNQMRDQVLYFLF